MPGRLDRRGPAVAPRAGPVRPGSPLYRLIQMIAREIARDHRQDRPEGGPDAAPEGTRPGGTSGREPPASGS